MKNPSLFSKEQALDDMPLAARMRPRSLDEFVGQIHLVGKGRLLRRAIQADMIASLIFAGPPGTGKTTLARVIANQTDSRFVSLNAVLSGVKDVREAIEAARETRELHGRRTILFVDEVHRWNKAQQDALLPWVENGTVVLIGATTENPFFEVNSALVSRSRIFTLKPLSEDELRRVAEQALSDPIRGYGRLPVEIDDDALDHLVRVADGDARSLLNALQLAVETTPERFPPPEGTRIRVTREIAEDSIQKRAVLYDKEGDYHFDSISAFIKSLRGSDPDAALYWMARMVSGGEDPRYIFRRMLILAAEDVGLADPQALVVIQAAAAAFDRVGLPEGNFHLAEAALYLATCPKSNSSLAFFDALSTVQSERRRDVPKHLRDSNRDKEELGHGEGYLYPHAYRDHWVAQDYLPDALRGRMFYQPSESGYEERIAEDVRRRREIQLEEAVRYTDEKEITSTGKEDERTAAWLDRAVRFGGQALLTVRARAFDRLAPKREDRLLVLDSGHGAFVWEALRRVPAGAVVGVLNDDKKRERAAAYASAAHPLRRPLLVTAGSPQVTEALGEIPPDSMLLDSPLRVPQASSRVVKAPAEAPAEVPGDLEKLRILAVERSPGLGTRLSELIDFADGELRAKVTRGEDEYLSESGLHGISPNSDSLRGAFSALGLALSEAEPIEVFEPRQITDEQVRKWTAPKGNLYVETMSRVLAESERDSFARILREQLVGRTVEWRVVFLLCGLRLTKETEF
jgi:putative ATPase